MKVSVSLMSARILLTLLNEQFRRTSARFYFSQDIEITDLKSHFNVKMTRLCHF